VFCFQTALNSSTIEHLQFLKLFWGYTRAPVKEGESGVRWRARDRWGGNGDKGGKGKEEKEGQGGVEREGQGLMRPDKLERREGDKLRCPEIFPLPPGNLISFVP
jgi:hypothetical protein